MTVSERLRSCWGPTWLARRSPVKQASETTSIAFEWTTKRLLWCPFQCVEWWRPHQSLQPSFMALSSEQSSCSGEFGCRSLVKLTLSSFTALSSSVCLLFVMWKTCVFLWATQACSMEKLTDLYNLLTFEYITLLARLKESHVNYNDLRES